MSVMSKYFISKLDSWILKICCTLHLTIKQVLISKNLSVSPNQRALQIPTLQISYNFLFAYKTNSKKSARSCAKSKPQPFISIVVGLDALHSSHWHSHDKCPNSSCLECNLLIKEQARKTIAYNLSENIKPEQTDLMDKKKLVYNFCAHNVNLIWCMFEE